jgi:hypothetical protein
MKASITAGLTCALLAGCYTYRPLPSVDAAMPAPGTQVEVRLTTAGAAALANQVGPDVLYLEGLLVAADSSALTLKMTRSETARRVSAEWKGEQVTLAREHIASVGARKLSVGATALLGGLAGGGLVAAYALLGGSGGTSGAVAPPGQGPQ